MQTLRPPQLEEPESAFQQDPQVFGKLTEIKGLPWAEG